MFMKKIVLITVPFFIVLSFVSSCIKTSENTCTNTSVAADSSAILSYLNSNAISGYVKHSSGLYYKIENPGGSGAPNLSSKVFVKYTGKFTDNRVFDSVSDPAKTGWVLGSLIEGWRIGIPLISKGGKIKLFIPSALGYGCTGGGAIPANTILVFDIELVDFL
jgi:FKBP-type peptidyl-prolyl cis-trans isomerase FkpA